MLITTEFENIVDVVSDAMIYSTNTRLALTGGVGSALVKKYGIEIQLKLINLSQGNGMELAEIGDVISVKTSTMPWKVLIHTVVTDGSYIATADIVKSVIEKAFNLCVENDATKKITISELGTGFGSLTSAQFNEILLSVLQGEKYKNIQKVVICKFGDGR
jgi:O-acetyl-ADP-ribose deacetylase (regulator of RNase III)